MWKEFKEFAIRGNIIDLAIGVIIGGAFQKIVTSLVNDIIMPAISIFTGKIDFNDLAFSVGSVSIKYGAFLTAILDFLVIALSIFFIIKYINKLNQITTDKLEKVNKRFCKKGDSKNKKKVEQVAQATTKTCPYCFSEINIKALKCPYCISDIEIKKDNNVLDKQIEMFNG